MNVAKIESSLKELADKPFNPSEFPFEFLAAYDVPKATVTKLRRASQPTCSASWANSTEEEAAVSHGGRRLGWNCIEGMAQQFEGKKDAPRILLCQWPGVARPGHQDGCRARWREACTNRGTGEQNGEQLKIESSETQDS